MREIETPAGPAAIGERLSITLIARRARGPGDRTLRSCLSPFREPFDGWLAWYGGVRSARILPVVESRSHGGGGDFEWHYRAGLYDHHDWSRDRGGQTRSRRPALAVLVVRGIHLLLWLVPCVG